MGVGCVNQGRIGSGVSVDPQKDMCPSKFFFKKKKDRSNLIY